MKRLPFHALVIGIFPVLLAAGILTIPVVADYSNHIMAEQAASQGVRWFWGHLISGLAFGLAIAAAGIISRYLSAKGRNLFGAVSLPFIAVGGALYAIGLGADGIGPLAAAAGGSRALVYFEGSSVWIGGVFVSASLIFGLGLIVQVVGVLGTGLLSGSIRVIVFVAAVIFVAAGAIPSGWGLYVVAAAGLAVYLTISGALWRQASHLEEQVK